MNTRIIMIGAVLAALVAASCTPLYAQSSSNRYSFTWNPRTVPLPPTERLTVRLVPSNHLTDYAIGISAEGNMQPGFSAGAVTLTPSPGGRMRLPSSITDLASDRIRVSSNTIEISPEPSQAVLLVYGRVTPDTVVEIQYGNTTIAVGSLDRQSSLMVQNGRLVPEPVRGVRTLLTALSGPQSHVSARNKPISLGEGKYFVTPSGLAKNLIVSTRPSLPVGETSCCTKTATLQIGIGTDGSIRTVNSIDGDATVLAQCGRAIRSWRFRPFVVDGQAVEVTALVKFFFAPDGRLSSPVFTELAQ